jgi:hypothetical protein
MPTLSAVSLSSAHYESAGASLLSKAANIAFNGEGFILSEDKAVYYDEISQTALCFDFDSKTKNLIAAQETPRHSEMLNYYKDITAASDKYLKSPK